MMHASARRLREQKELYVRQRIIFSITALWHNSGIELQAGHGLRQSGDRLTSAATHAEAAAGSLQRELHRLGAAQQSLVWKSGLTFLLGSLLAVAGSGYLVWKNHQALKRAEFPAALAEAMRTGALSSCDGSICARVGKRPKRFGNRGEYVEIK